MSHHTPGDKIKRYLQANIADDFPTLESLRHPEWHEIWPQSGETVLTSDDYHQSRMNRPEGAPTVRMGREWGGSGDQWWAETIVEYQDGSRWLAISLFELRDGLIYRERVYFGQAFPPAGWRAAWVQQGPPAIG